MQNLANNDSSEQSSQRYPILLFDGVCNFCNASVQFVIKRDSQQQFRFCPIQSPQGQQLMQQYHLQDSELSSMIFVYKNKAYRKSSAALHILKLLDFPWPLMHVFTVVPKFVRDAVYDFVGKRRYQWFGKTDSCWIPDDAVKKRFLNLTPHEPNN